MVAAMTPLGESVNVAACGGNGRPRSGLPGAPGRGPPPDEGGVRGGLSEAPPGDFFQF